MPQPPKPTIEIPPHLVPLTCDKCGDIWYGKPHVMVREYRVNMPIRLQDMGQICCGCLEDSNYELKMEAAKWKTVLQKIAAKGKGRKRAQKALGEEK